MNDFGFGIYGPREEPDDLEPLDDFIAKSFEKNKLEYVTPQERKEYFNKIGLGQLEGDRELKLELYEAPRSRLEEVLAERQANNNRNLAKPTDSFGEYLSQTPLSELVGQAWTGVKGLFGNQDVNLAGGPASPVARKPAVPAPLDDPMALTPLGGITPPAQMSATPSSPVEKPEMAPYSPTATGPPPDLSADVAAMDQVFQETAKKPEPPKTKTRMIGTPPEVQQPEPSLMDQAMDYLPFGGFLQSDEGQQARAGQATLTEPPRQPEELGVFQKGLGRGVHNTLTNILAGSAAIADAVGNVDLTHHWMENYVEIADDAERLKGIPFEQALDSPSHFLGWAAGAVGEQVPVLASIAASGGLGGVLGHLTAKGLVREGLKEAAEQAAKQWAARGAIGASATAMGLQEAGGIYGEQQEAGLEPNPFIAIAGGAINGVLETLVPFTLAKGMGLGGRFTNKVMEWLGKQGAMTRIFAWAGGASAGEGLVEELQEEVAIAARKAVDESYEWAGDEANARRLQSAATGALVGGILGGPIGIGATGERAAAPDTERSALPTESPASAVAPSPSFMPSTPEFAERIEESVAQAPDMLPPVDLPVTAHNLGMFEGQPTTPEIQGPPRAAELEEEQVTEEQILSALGASFPKETAPKLIKQGPAPMSLLPPGMEDVSMAPIEGQAPITAPLEPYTATPEPQPKPLGKRAQAQQDKAAKAQLADLYDTFRYADAMDDQDTMQQVASQLEAQGQPLPDPEQFQAWAETRDTLLAAQKSLGVAGQERGFKAMTEVPGKGGTKEVQASESPTDEWYQTLTTKPAASKHLVEGQKAWDKHKIDRALEEGLSLLPGETPSANVQVLLDAVQADPNFNQLFLAEKEADYTLDLFEDRPEAVEEKPAKQEAVQEPEAAQEAKQDIRNMADVHPREGIKMRLDTYHRGIAGLADMAESGVSAKVLDKQITAIQQAIANDLTTGHLNQVEHDRLLADLSTAYSAKEAQPDPFALTPLAQPKAKATKAIQPELFEAGEGLETGVSRIIGREPTLEEAPLFSKTAREEQPEQSLMPFDEPMAPMTSKAGLADVGEKIGGARKDIAIKTGPKAQKEVSTDPGWKRRYEVSQIAKSRRPGEEGKWTIRDTKKKDWMGQPKQLVDLLFDTQEEAEAAIPLAAVARNHRTVPIKDGKYEIWRDVTDRKRLKIVDEQFASREDAMRYMAEHAEEIIETKTSFGEEILPIPDRVTRTGEDYRQGKDVEPEQVRSDFGLRAVEFGNWENQDERQQVVNHAYDGLHDLARLLEIPAEAIGLNGDLGLAFGARGHGLAGARAHYEPDYGVMNLTKMKGAGTLAHEWFHAADHYFGRQDTKAGTEKKPNERGDMVYPWRSAERDFASHGFRATGSRVREEVRQAYNDLINTMFKKAEQYVEDTQQADRFVAQTKDRVVKALASIRKNLSEQLNAEFYKRKNAPASAEQLTEFDDLAQKIVDGELLSTEYRHIEEKAKRSKWNSGRWTNDALERLSVIYKDVRGRSGFGSNEQRGIFDDLRKDMNLYSARLKMLAEAQSGDTKTKKVPTEFAMEAKRLDQGRASDYWTSNHEMAARAFQAYVEDKIAEKGGQSDFLSYGTHMAVPTPWGWVKPYPHGTEREAMNAAFDKLFQTLQTKQTDKGVALFEKEAPYAVSETTQAVGLSGDATSAERRAGQSRADRLHRPAPPDRTPGRPEPRRAVSLREGGGVRTIGKRLTDQLTKERRLDLRGHQLYSPGDLANLAQIYRNPQYETLRVWYVKDGKVVGHEGLTTRLPNVVSFAGDKKGIQAYLDRIGKMVQRFNADGYYLQHNHPSGDPTPSKEDMNMTAMVQQRVPGFKGHVIINHQQYAAISSQPTSETLMPFPTESEVGVTFHDIDNADFRQDPHKPHLLLGTRIKGTQDVVRMAQAVQSPTGYTTVIYSGAKGQVEAIQEVPNNMVRSPDFKGYIRNSTRHFGATSAYTYANQPDAEIELITMELTEKGILRDALTEKDEMVFSAREFVSPPPDQVNLSQGLTPKQAFKQTRKVMEEEAEYRPPAPNLLRALVDLERQAIRKPTAPTGEHGKPTPVTPSPVPATPTPKAKIYQKMNQAIREEHVTAWEKGRQWLRRQFAPGGLLPESVFHEKISRDSEFNVIELMVEHLVGQLETTIKQDYGVKARKLDETTQTLLSKVMAGELDQQVPEKTKAALLGMRQYIDGLSAQYVAILEGQADQLSQEVSTLQREGYALKTQRNAILMQQAKAAAPLKGPTAKMDDLRTRVRDIQTKQAALNAKRATIKTITSNIGEYVNRSYKAFDDPKWALQVPDAVLDAARDHLIDRYTDQGMEAKAAAKRTEVVLNEILKHGTAYEGLEGMIHESKLGAKDLSVLIHRKTIAAPIRALLGEYTDPRVTFAKSATKMGRLIWNQTFLDRVRDQGMNAFLWTEETKPPEATAKIAADQSEVYSPLNGLWTTPEIDQAFQDALGKEQMANWYRTIVQMNGLVKFGKTVLSPTTAARNWMSAAFFAIANGHFDMRQMAKSVSGLREYFTHQGSEEKLAYLRKLKQLGVVYDTPYAGEMMRLLEDSKLPSLLSGHESFEMVTDGMKYATKFYQYGDDFWKILGFENEKALLRGVGFSETDAEVKAAERIRNTYPTYSMVGRAMQFLRRFPLAGTFVSFPSEIIRTSANILRYAAKDMKDPKMRPLVKRRIAGILVAGGFFPALQALSMGWMGMDDDDDEAVRLMAAPWQRNSTLVYTGRDADGNLRYFDGSYMDPYNLLKRPLMAIMRNQPWQEAAKDAIVEQVEPFLGTDIAAQAIFEILANKKESGAPVYHAYDETVNQITAIANHVRKTLQPGVMSNLERTWKALDGQTSPSGRKYDLLDEGLAWVGFRMSTLDPKVALYYRAFDFKDAKNDADKKVRQALMERDVDDEDIQAAKELNLRLRTKAFREMSLLVEAAEQAGMFPADIQAVLKSSKISKDDIRAIMLGTVPAYAPQRKTVNEQVKKAERVLGEDRALDIRDRYQTYGVLPDEPEDDNGLLDAFLKAVGGP